MTTVALRGILGRKLRTALTAFAIVLGVAMVGGGYLLTDSISKAFDTIFASSYAKTDAVISGRSLTDYSNAGRATVSPQLLARVRNTPGVEAAAGEIFDLNSNADVAKLIDKHGKVITGNGSPTFGLGVDPSQPRFNPLRLTSGRWAGGPGEVVLDAGSASKYHFAVGERIRIAVGGPARTFRVVGVARYGNVNTIGSATFAIFDVNVAKRLLHKSGYDAISVAAAHGVSADELVSRLRAIVPAHVQVRTGDEQAQEDKKGVAGFVSFLRYVLLGFGGLALFVGAFVIFNTLSITVAQRTRELATLRTLGASRRQVLRSVVAEALAIGFVSSLVGLVVGFGLAKGLIALFTAAGLDLPRAGIVVAPRTVLISLAVGTLVTVLAGLLPALRATEVPPISAVREGACVPKGRLLAVRAARLAGAHRSRRGVDRVRPLRPRDVGRRARGVDRRGCAGALRRRRDDRVAARAADRGRRRPRGVVDRRRRRPPRTGERRAEPGTHGVHRRGVDDRPRARHVPLRVRDGPARLAVARRRAAAQRRLRRRLAERLVADASAGRQRDRPHRRRERRVERAQRACALRPREHRRLGCRPEHDRVRLPVPRCEIRRLCTEPGQSSARRGRRITTSPSARRFAIVTPAGKRVQLTVAALYDPAKLDNLLGHVLITKRTFDASFETPGDAYTFVRASDPSALAQDAEGVPGRAAAHGAEVRREPRVGPQVDPEHALRAARPVRAREPVRDGEHARARRVRANA